MQDLHQRTEGIVSWYDFLTGGMTASTNPASYSTPGAHQGQVENMVNTGVAGLQNRAAPQLNAGPQDQFRNAQMQQMGQLQHIAGGQQAGAGELAVQRQMQNALAGQQAMARIRGAGGGGMLAASRQGAALGSSAAGMGQQAAMQDQMNAQGLLANVAGQGRGQDIGFANSNAQLQQNQMGMNDQAYQAFINSLTGMDANQQAAQVAAMQAATQRQGLLGGLLSTGGQVAGAAIMASDERLKTDISDAGGEVDEMLDALKPYRYRYKDEKFGQGARAGIMAQDLERSAAGRRVVTETADGKMLDVNKALSAALAGVARVNERLRKVEARG